MSSIIAQCTHTQYTKLNWKNKWLHLKAKIFPFYEQQKFLHTSFKLWIKTKLKASYINWPKNYLIYSMLCCNYWFPVRPFGPSAFHFSIKRQYCHSSHINQFCVSYGSVIQDICWIVPKFWSYILRHFTELKTLYSIYCHIRFTLTDFPSRPLPELVNLVRLCKIKFVLFIPCCWNYH
jgi:hypothetical protein